MAVEWDTLVGQFASTVGKEKAESMVSDAVNDCGFGKKGSYSEDEALEIADAIHDSDDATTYIRIAANTLKTKVQTGNGD